MEEYEPHIERGNVVYAGVDYEAILREAEKDPEGCDVILWDGGNNDFPFYKPDLHITVADPHRAGHELTLLSRRGQPAHGRCGGDQQDRQRLSAEHRNRAAQHPLGEPRGRDRGCRFSDQGGNPELIKGKRVLVVEDGPTLTHGEMKLGAGTIAAQKYGAAEIVDPRPAAVGSLMATFAVYPHIGALLPAMGYSDEQRADLEATIANVDCDAVIIGTPIDLNRVVKIKQPNTRVFYDLQEIGSPNLEEILAEFIERHKLGK